jgi:NADH:ubiquinone oxidoreductase subunit 5 (subunit L)/multisubunit Na+/H+ antiporter MnhA subunit
MTDSDKNGNIFKIMDEIIFQLNKTKKMFIIMILTIMIIPPVALLFTSVIFDPPFEDQEDKTQRDGPKPKFVIYRVIPLIISAVWLGIGIRQWIVLSKWTKKYDRYKKLQEKIDKKLDDDEQQNDSLSK